MPPRKSTSSSSKKSSTKRKTSSSSKRKTTTAPKRKTISSPKQKLKWLTAKEALIPGHDFRTDDIFFPFEFVIKKVNKEQSKIHLRKIYENNLKNFLWNLSIQKVIYMHRKDSGNSAKYIIVAHCRDGTYLYWSAQFKSTGTLDFRKVDEIIVELYEYKTWSALYKKLSVSIKKEIEKGNYGNLIDGNGIIGSDVTWAKSSSTKMKEFVKKWFDLEPVKEYAAKKKLKKYDIATQQKKQVAALSGVEGVAYMDYLVDYDINRFSVGTGKFAIDTCKLVFVAKRNDGKYVYLHNLLADKSKGIDCEMNVAIFDNWEELWNKLPSSIRREIK